MSFYLYRPRPCASCRRRAWRWCLVCGRRCCRNCRVGSNWTWCCLRPECRDGFNAAKRARNAQRLQERTLICPRCLTWYERRVARVMEPDERDLMHVRLVVLQLARCACRVAD